MVDTDACLRRSEARRYAVSKKKLRVRIDVQELVAGELSKEWIGNVDWDAQAG